MKRFLVFALVLAFAFSLTACVTQTAPSDNSVDKSNSSTISTNENEIGNNLVDKSNSAIPTEDKIKVITELEHYFFDSKVTFSIFVDSDVEFYYGQNYFVEYLDADGSWKKCEKEYFWTEELLISTYDAKLSFTLSDRADAGKEKYRIGINVGFITPSSEEMHYYTVYSNEFTAE